MALCIGACKLTDPVPELRGWDRCLNGAVDIAMKSASLGDPSVDSGMGPFLLAWTRRVLGSYDAAFVLFALVAVPFAVIGLLATPPAPRGEVKSV